METCNTLLTDPFSQSKHISILKTGKNITISPVWKDKTDAVLSGNELQTKYNISQHMYISNSSNTETR